MTAGIERTRVSIERNLRHYRKIQKRIGGTDNGGELVVYFSGKSVRNIQLDLGLSNKFVNKAFYFHNHQLIMVVEREQFYGWNDQKQTFDPAHPKPATVNRYYFYDAKILHWTENARSMSDPSNRKEMAKRGSQSVLEARSLLKKSGLRQEEVWLH